jgi:hypothetical protein
MLLSQGHSACEIILAKMYRSRSLTTSNNFSTRTDFHQIVKPTLFRLYYALHHSQVDFPRALGDVTQPTPTFRDCF